MSKRLTDVWPAVFLFMILILAMQGCVSSTGRMTQQAPAGLSPEDRVAWYTRALKESPDDPELMLKLGNARQEASMAHLKSGEELMEKGYLEQAVQDLQMSIAFYPANARAVELVDRARKMKASRYHDRKGESLAAQGAFEGALSAFKKAVELDPDNQSAQKALDRYRLETDPLAERFGLALSSSEPVSLKFKKTPLLNVFEILSRLSGVNFIFDKDVKESRVSLFMTDVRFERFLEVLLETSELKARPVDKNTLLVYPDTLAKAKRYDDLIIKTFYLSHLTAKDAVAIVAKILKSKDIVANESLNAITVRGSRADVEMTGRILQANDLAPAEVVLNVEIMEVSRTKEKNLGLSTSDSLTLGISETSNGIEYYEDSNFGFAGLGSLEDIGNLTKKELYLSLPTATLNLLKQDADTRTLAKPRIRVKNFGKAAIHIGERVPLRSNRRVQTDGSITYDFQYQDVGIKLTSEPVITRENQVNLKLDLEISSLGNNVGTVDDPQYAIKSKNTSTVLTINDGETVILGGLIQDDERETIKRVPLLGDIPAMGRLFSNHYTENEETDILMTITPVVIRSRDDPAPGAARFWAGSEAVPSTREPWAEQARQENRFSPTPVTPFPVDAPDAPFLYGPYEFTVQVNAFESIEEARTRSEELGAQGYDTLIRTVEIPEKGTWHRVFAGRYDSFLTAEEAAGRMKADRLFSPDVFAVDRDYVYGD